MTLRWRCAGRSEAQHGQAPVVVLDGRCLRGRSSSRDVLRGSRNPELPHTRGGGGRLGNWLLFYQNQQLCSKRRRPCPRWPSPIWKARLVIESVLAERRKVLTEMESKALLSAFHIPVTKTMLARTANEAMMIATQLVFPWR